MIKVNDCVKFAGALHIVNSTGPDVSILRDVYANEVTAPTDKLILATDEDKHEFYAKNNGAFCPECLSSDIEGGFPSVIGLTAYHPITCDSCGHEWEDEFSFRRVKEIEQ